MNRILRTFLIVVACLSFTVSVIFIVYIIFDANLVGYYTSGTNKWIVYNDPVLKINVENSGGWYIYQDSDSFGGSLTFSKKSRTNRLILGLLSQTNIREIVGEPRDVLIEISKGTIMQNSSFEEYVQWELADKIPLDKEDITVDKISGISYHFDASISGTRYDYYKYFVPMGDYVYEIFVSNYLSKLTQLQKESADELISTIRFTGNPVTDYKADFKPIRF